jgi:predicted ATP-binding protein involved in virulence
MIEHGPTRIESITLENYRLFDSLHIDLHPELTVFVASNGGGKTAILDAIATAIRPFVDILDGYGRRAKRIPVTDVRRVLDPSGRMQLVLPMHLSMRLRLDGVRHETEAGLNDEKGRQPKTSSGIEDQARNLRQAIIERAQEHSLPPVDLPLIAYYGTGRLWNHPEKPVSRKRHVDPDPTPNSPLRGYTQALESASHYRQFVAAFRRISGEAASLHFPNELRKRAPLVQLVTIGSAIQTAIGQGTDWRELWWDWDEDRLVAVDKNRSRLPVDSLSDGIRTMIGLVGDLAYRASLMNPHIVGEPLARVSGIVLIDEIDMHLHPEWQQIVIGSLRGVFPRVQFIVTTHSPQVLSTVPRECVRIIEHSPGNGWRVRVPEEQTEGVGSALLLATVMGVDSTPDNEHVRRLREYGSLIADGNAAREDARALRELLDTHFGAQSAVMLECDRVIRLEEMKRKMLRREGT